MKSGERPPTPTPSLSRCPSPLVSTGIQKPTRFYGDCRRTAKRSSINGARNFRSRPATPSALSRASVRIARARQFVRPDRLDAILGKRPPEIEWLTPGDIAQRLRSLREDHAAWRNPRDTGQFSLAGAQPKTALLLEEGRWGIPSGRTPTTHILKPPTAHFDGHAENEHFCLELGRAIGLPVANSEVMCFKDEIAIVIERYDRVHAGNVWQRVHQEDTCQALSIQPTRKYQSDGGPGVREIVDLLKTFSSKAREDIGTFLDAVYYNWLIAGTDAHAKNYALLIASAGQVRLAPLYDIASILPYPDIYIRKARSSMKIANEYRLRNIGKY